MENGLSLSELMQLVQEAFSYEELCKLYDPQKRHYSELLDHFVFVNSRTTGSREKGAALEELVAYLLEISGNVFEIVKNVHTSTNEIDEIVKLNSKGRALEKHGLLSSRLITFLGECKNYSKSIAATYTGKFYSLLLTTGNTTGILFSYHGVSGQGWRYSAGLVKKIYLQRENPDNRIAIIDFSLHDFQSIISGDYLFSIIDRKLDALQYDTSVDSFISHHPAETMFLSS